MRRFSARLNRLAVVARPDPLRARDERELRTQFAWAFNYPGACSKPDPRARYDYLCRTLAGHPRLPPAAIRRALVAALVEVDMPPDDAREMVQGFGMDMVLRIMSAAPYDASRERLLAATTDADATALREALGRMFD